MFRQDMRRILRSPVFYFSILVVEICIVAGAWEDLSEINDFVFLGTMGWFASGSSMICYAIPLLAGLAVSDSYCIERKDGYHYSVMSRGSKLRYCISKIVTANLSGMMMMAAAEILFVVVCFVVRRGDLVLSTDLISKSFFENTWHAVFFEKGCPIMAWVSWMLSYCVAASIFPGISLCVSLVIRNRYVVMAAPFVLEEIEGTLLVALHKYNCTFSQLLPGHPGTPYDGWLIRIAVVVSFWMAEILLFVWGIMRETR
jgi:hypothetical protein